MSSGLALQSDPAPVLACTVSRNVHHFDLLIEDMEAELGEAWGDLSFEEARAFLEQPEAAELQFLALAVKADDDLDFGMVGDLIAAAKGRGLKSILVAHDLSPAALHELLRLGADDFVPYPLSEGSLHDAILRSRQAPAAVAGPSSSVPGNSSVAVAPRMEATSAIFAVQGLAGGTGASTLAVNLAWELANIDKKQAPSVCIMDFDLQAGTVSTYLDLPRRDMVTEILQEAKTMDVDAFKQSLLTYEEKLSVFSAPPEVLPLDLIGPDEVNALLDFATQCFDIVVIDMPHTLVIWTETVLQRCDVYFTTMELDMRSAQNAMRFLKALRAEELPIEKLNFVLNRAPGMTDLNGKTRVKKLSESLSIKISTHLPDGGKAVMQAGDHGEPLAEIAKKNPLRREINKLSMGLFKAMLAENAAAK